MGGRDVQDKRNRENGKDRGSLGKKQGHFVR